MTIQRACLAIVFGAAMFVGGGIALGQTGSEPSRETALLALAFIGVCHAVAGYFELGAGAADAGPGLSVGRVFISVLISLLSLSLAFLLALARPIVVAPESAKLALTACVLAALVGVCIAYLRSRRGDHHSAPPSTHRTLA